MTTPGLGKAIRPEDRTLEYLTTTVRAIWRVIKDAERFVRAYYPRLAEWEPLPDELEFLHAEDILAAYPDLPRKERETAILRAAHLGEVSVTVWPQVLKDMCEERNIRVLE